MSRNYQIIVFSAFLGLNWFACGKNLEDPVAPARPEWVSQSAPFDTLESGIDADPNGDVILLQWLNGSEEDLSGYRIYRRETDADGPFTLLSEFNASTIPGIVNTYIDEEVTVDRPCFYFLRAFDQAGNLSSRSDTIQYCLVTKAEPQEPVGTITTTQPVFRWSDMGTRVTEYVIRVEQISPLKNIWLCHFTRQSYIPGELQTKAFGGSVTVVQRPLENNHSYRWRVDGIYNFDRNNNEIAGSESAWCYFNVQL